MPVSIVLCKMHKILELILIEDNSWFYERCRTRNIYEGWFC